ncbi:HAD family hydrolase [Hyphomicrobium sp. CS1GBMeth3]|uniref:HAD family hydrolase n=1 Tax=Hyphomicrobium sp. CS1GBMeth3 TaxID=1892845 RepID=UPI0009317123|nr:HAD family hydrolase [Hyphomicrobium sp. CS1GBMeth3]
MTSDVIRTLASRRLFLAVDLDGTFLGGSDSDRQALYGLISARRNDIALVFVTGRDIPFASNVPTLFGTPQPDLIVGDVGTSVVVAPGWEPHPEIERWIDSRWPGPERASKIMLERPEIELQTAFGGRRLSYFYRDRMLASAAAREIEEAGYAALMSADLFFDVLPRGVDKGQTLLKLLAHEGIGHDRVLCAGDTLNDFSLFSTGLRGVAVANSEPYLKAALQAFTNVYMATREGAGGILEAIEHFELLSPGPG